MDCRTKTPARWLEENYRSRENILANQLIANNTQRIDKIPSPHAESVSRFCYRADDEIAEAEFVVHQLRTLERQHPEINWGSFAVLTAPMPNLAL